MLKNSCAKLVTNDQVDYIIYKNSLQRFSPKSYSGISDWNALNVHNLQKDFDEILFKGLGLHSYALIIITLSILISQGLR